MTAQKYSADLAANTLTDLTGGGVTSGDAGTFLISLVNRGATATTVRVAVTKSGAPTNADYIEWDAPLPPNGVLSRWPVPLAQGWRVYVLAAAADVSATVIGRKEG